MNSAHSPKLQLIEINNISVSLIHQKLNFKALEHVSFNIHKGQHTAILGANGAGKSTLLEVMGGYRWIDTTSDPSEIIWFDPNYPLIPEKSPIYARAASRLISPVQQENYIQQAWNLSGLELILTGFENSPLLYAASSKAQRELAHDLAENLNIMHLLSKNIREFSQGQLRILLLAKALVCKPNILLLDEYLDGLDATARTKIMHYLDQMSQELTIILTTHRQMYLPPWIKQVISLEQGKVKNIKSEHIESEQTTSTIIESKQIKSEQDPILKAQGENSTLNIQDPILKAQGENSTINTQDHALNHVIIDVVNANIFIDRTHVLHNINWALKNGEHWQITGNNGTGKSTFLRLLARDEYPADDGHIEYFFQAEQAQPKLATETNFIKQKVHLVSDLAQSLYHYNVTVEEAVLSAFDASIGVYRDFTAHEYDQARYWLSIVGMEKFSKHNLHKLSTGQARRIFLARALVANPKVLLLDEPFSGLDHESRQHIIDILKHVCSKNIQTILVSHYQEDTLEACNRHAHMDNGRLLIIK